MTTGNGLSLLATKRVRIGLFVMAIAVATLAIANAAKSQHSAIQPIKFTQHSKTFSTFSSLQNTRSRKPHALRLSYGLNEIQSALDKNLLIYSVFNNTSPRSHQNTFNYFNLSTLSIVKWPILNSENLLFSAGLNENSTGVKLDAINTTDRTNAAVLDITSKKIRSYANLAKKDDHYFSTQNYIQTITGWMGIMVIIYLVALFVGAPVLGAISASEKRKTANSFQKAQAKKIRPSKA